MEGPEFPAEMQFLWAIYRDHLYGQSGFSSESGKPLPLTHTTVRHACKNLDVRLAPHEIEGVLMLDKAYLYPGTAEDEGAK